MFMYNNLISLLYFLLLIISIKQYPEVRRTHVRLPSTGVRHASPIKAKCRRRAAASQRRIFSFIFNLQSCIGASNLLIPRPSRL
jgi:hypothetical protein